MYRKYPIIIFLIVIIITAFFAAFALANNDKFKDSDNDGLNDYDEKNIYYTDWNNPDTDNDSYPDGLEVKNGYSPTQKKLKLAQVDTDKDGLNDDWEIALGSNLNNKDTDGDNYSDGDEVKNDYSPLNSNSIKIEKRIEVKIAELRLYFYINNKLIDSFPISAGKPKTPTPQGEFKIIAKYPSKNYNIYRNTKWNMHFTTQKGLRYYIHGAYWHNKFGLENVAGGCVNLRYEDMERLYNFTPVGTKVIIN